MSPRKTHLWEVQEMVKVYDFYDLRIYCFTTPSDRAILLARKTIIRRDGRVGLMGFLPPRRAGAEVRILRNAFKRYPHATGRYGRPAQWKFRSRGEFYDFTAYINL